MVPTCRDNVVGLWKVHHEIACCNIVLHRAEWRHPRAEIQLPQRHLQATKKAVKTAFNACLYSFLGCSSCGNRTRPISPESRIYSMPTGNRVAIRVAWVSIRGSHHPTILHRFGSFSPAPSLGLHPRYACTRYSSCRVLTILPLIVYRHRVSLLRGRSTRTHDGDRGNGTEVSRDGLGVVGSDP